MKKIILFALVLFLVAVVCGVCLECAHEGLQARQIFSEMTEYARIGFGRMYDGILIGVAQFKSWIGK